MKKIADDVLLATVRAVREEGSQPKAAAKLGTTQSCISRHMKDAKERGLIRDHKGEIEVFESKKALLPPRGKRKVYYLTSAQTHTKLHEAAWKNLMALVKHDSATLYVSGFVYNKDAQGQRAAAKGETKADEEYIDYPPEVVPFLCNDRIDLSRNLTFCGELNVLPTAVNPLEGLEHYTYRKSTIVPHPKLAMESIPTMKTEGVKLMFTTGCITRRNYIKRKAGFKADHFHSYGALIVEVDDKGRWYCRQVIQGGDGSMYDLDRRSYKGHVSTGHRVADIAVEVHAQKMDKAAADLVFGHRKDSIFEVLRPQSVHVHDILDFGGRGHHTRKDPHQVYRAHREGRWEVTPELALTADVLWNQISRPWSHTIVVNSNHDRWLERWLKEVDWRSDPANAKTILELNLVALNAIDSGMPLNLVEVALRNSLAGLNLKTAKNSVRFLAEDESSIILPDIDGGIEGGLHGDRGANGAKGTIQGIARTDRKTNMGDKHQAAIVNHVYCCGFVGLLDQGYNHGLGSWTQAVTGTYMNGTRAIISLWKGAWRVPQ